MPRKPSAKKSLFSPAYDRFLKLLKETRLAAGGMSQNEAARRLNRPQSFLSKIESGERRVDVVELAEICQAYGVKIEDFVKKL